MCVTPFCCLRRRERSVTFVTQCRALRCEIEAFSEAYVTERLFILSWILQGGPGEKPRTLPGIPLYLEILILSSKEIIIGRGVAENEFLLPCCSFIRNWHRLQFCIFCIDFNSFRRTHSKKSKLYLSILSSLFHGFVISYKVEGAAFCTCI